MHDIDDVRIVRGPLTSHSGDVAAEVAPVLTTPLPAAAGSPPAVAKVLLLPAAALPLATPPPPPPPPPLAMPLGVGTGATPASNWVAIGADFRCAANVRRRAEALT
ncbi:hypothetical protein Vretifemale_12625 [Volvox reticuliferus]|uniref:Uncharacterized protein n=1 Tax=Volvox reticuliferus TaxID=1737510 RepID=A0A8J4CIV7_9CHLO|nr:hypothetical protein Vretifemale_12625 [Volvox reticuliferus]